MMRMLIGTASRLARKGRLLGLSRAIEDRRGRPLVVGFLSAPSGIGSGARAILDAFHDAGLNPAAADMTERFQPGLSQIDWRRGRVFEPDDGAGPLVVHVNAPEAPYVLSELGRDRLQGRLRIGYWAWEFAHLPARWPRELVWYHECWAPSRFTADAIQGQAGDTPVRAVGYPLKPVPADPKRAAALRARFGAAEGKLVLNAFDMRSSMDRKNPVGAIEIFRKGAGDDPGARLVLKAASWGWSGANDRRIIEAIGGDPRIHLLTEVLNHDDMAALVRACDIYLSPHRCEGFGLMLAQTLLAGRRVMMTGWSGNEDFADLPGAQAIPFTLEPAEDASGVYSRGVGDWASPDIGAAARILQGLLAETSKPAADVVAEAAAERFGARRWLESLGPVFWSRIDLDLTAQ